VQALTLCKAIRRSASVTKFFTAGKKQLGAFDSRFETDQPISGGMNACHFRANTVPAPRGSDQIPDRLSEVVGLKKGASATPNHFCYSLCAPLNRPAIRTSQLAKPG
jgi:hypothetical protein